MKPLLGVPAPNQKLAPKGKEGGETSKGGKKSSTSLILKGKGNESYGEPNTGFRDPLFVKKTNIGGRKDSHRGNGRGRGNGGKESHFSVNNMGSNSFPQTFIRRGLRKRVGSRKKSLLGGRSPGK